MDLARHIEHTILSATCTDRDIDRVVREAIAHRFLGVCVPPFWVQRARREIGSSGVLLVTVAGFPLGYSLTETKLDEIRRALDHGADEIDMVMNVSSFKTGLPWTKVDVSKCTGLVHQHDRLLKVILETAYLTEEEIVSACALCADAGADIVKTSTGFASAGAVVEHVRLMRSVLPPSVGVKAAGGIKTAEFARQLVEAGADRLGTSSGIAIVSEGSPAPGIPY